MKPRPHTRFLVRPVLQKTRFTALPSVRNQKKSSGPESFVLKLDMPSLKRRIQFVLQLTSDFSHSLNIRFCDAQEMRICNADFREKDYATDVLSFPARPGVQDPDSPQLYCLGDILICVEVCFAQAKKARHTLSKELEKMLVHAIVHLKGFDHERSKDAWRVMLSLERSIALSLEQAMGPAVWCQVRSLQ